MKPVNATVIGARLRELRMGRNETLREAAASASMDPALLSKIERGHRLPTAEQVAGLAKHFGLIENQLQAQRIAVDFLTRYGDSRFADEAILIIQEALK